MLDLEPRSYMKQAEQLCARRQIYADSSQLLPPLTVFLCLAQTNNTHMVLFNDDRLPGHRGGPCDAFCQ